MKGNKMKANTNTPLTLFSRHGFSRKRKSVGGKRLAGNALYDYSSPTAREDTVSFLIDFSARSKQNTCAYWQRMKRYYDGKHDGNDASVFNQKNDLPFEAALCTDGYIQVESQIDIRLPDFEFSPRTADADDIAKAKQREAITRFVCDIGELETKNALNERRLGIEGSAVWKVCWDAEENGFGNSGEVTIVNPKPQEIFPDPTAKNVDDCEYIGYVYRMHKMKARRLFANDAARLGLDIDELLSSGDTMSGILDGIEMNDSESYDIEKDTVRITEWWYRQPEDGNASIAIPPENGREKAEKVDYSWEAGDVALSVFIGDKEIRNIPKYWKNTNCKMMPFVIYSRVAGDNGIWGKSELEAIIPVIEAADRELAFAQLNAAFSSNDIIVAEENALADDCNLENSPGAVWTLRPGMMGKVQRLGNAAYNQTALFNNFGVWRDILQNTTGNFDSFNGNEPQKVTTATGIALLNERAKSRSSLKKVGRTSGFKRLYSLIDISALEYYDDGRIIAINGGKNDGEKQTIVYRFSDYSKKDGKASSDVSAYIPVVDVKIHVGDGLENSKAFTVSAITDLIRTPITKDNYTLVMAFVELIGLPMRKEICDTLKATYEPNVSPGQADTESNHDTQKVKEENNE